MNSRISQSALAIVNAKESQSDSSPKWSPGIRAAATLAHSPTASSRMMSPHSLKNPRRTSFHSGMRNR